MAKKPRTKLVTVSFTKRLKLARKLCPQCGKAFRGVLVQKLCSNACVQRASYARHAEQRRKARMAKYYRERGREEEQP
jgi:hypothetical protein